MQQTNFSVRNDGVEGARMAGVPGVEALNVALIYQDAATWQWARHACSQLSESSGRTITRPTEWKIGDLREAALFSEGVGALARADFIVVAVREADRLPGAFYLWVNLWLQLRAGRPGTLLALIVRRDLPEGANETRRYLCAAAAQGGLEFLVEQSNQPLAPIEVLRDDRARWARAA